MEPISGLQSGYALATLVISAWALVVCRYSDTDDVTFGVATAQREWASENSLPCGADPRPMRVRPEYSGTIGDYLKVVRTEEDELKKHKDLRLEEIRQLSTYNADACGFQNAIVFFDGTQELSRAIEQVTDHSTLRSYPLLLVCKVEDHQVTFGSVFDPDRISRVQLGRALRQTRQALLQLCNPSSILSIRDLDLVSYGDIAEISCWNQELPEYVDSCVHHIILEQALRRPDAKAVCSWDGNLSYRELDRLSTRLAYHLRASGVACEDFIPLLFEKSKWHVVAMLGVLKAGAAFVVLLSPETAKVDLGEVTVNQLSSTADEWLPQTGEVSEDVISRNAVYVVFTSGSTGKPKGVVVEHGALCSKSNPRTEALGRSESSRVLQFASFSFDTSIEDILTTMMFGGCVCIPSEDDRVNDLEGIMNHMRVSCAHITPSLANTLHPEDIPTLKQLRLGGEPMTTQHVTRWATKLDLKNAYGPTECTITSAVSQPLQIGSDPTNIGHAVACRAWIVDANDNDRLSPIGCVGELLIEGPILARGYFKDPTKTAESFIVNPSWFVSFESGEKNPSDRRFYKTGDLVVYASDGSLKYLGRKDSQVKLRGQRIELGEVETHVKHSMPDVDDVAAEVLVLSQDPTNAILVAFVALGRLYQDGDETALLISSLTRTTLTELVTLATEQLQLKLPRYMIPTIFVPLKMFPRTISGKTDRKILKKFASSIGSAELRSFSTMKLAASIMISGTHK